MANSFEALWGAPTAAGFEPFDRGSATGAGAGFTPLGGFAAPPPATAPEPEPRPSDPEASVSSMRSGEFAAAASSSEESPRVDDSAILSDVALLKAREEAYEVGRNEGLEAGRVEIAGQLARVADLLEQVEGARKDLAARSIEDLAAAVIHISRAIVGRELAVDSDGVEDLVRSIFKEVRSEDEIIVRVAQEDASMMREAYPALLEMVGRDGEVHILVDGSLQPGGAIVETSTGTIDASIEAQFASFADEIKAWTVQELEVRDD